jgi:hypothetical protein
MTEVIYTEAARADLLDIWLYICDESLATADHVLDALGKDVMLLARYTDAIKLIQLSWFQRKVYRTNQGVTGSTAAGVELTVETGGLD